MSYSQDFREFVVSKIQGGMSRSEAIEFFKVSRDSIYKWLKKHSETGSLVDRKRKQYKPRKIDATLLKAAFDENPYATLDEVAKKFNCWPQSIHKRCVKLGITRKKTRQYTPREMKKKAGVSDEN